MYIPVVGLEIHLQVKTNSKMFCRCSAQYFNTEANTNTCPVCFGLPGALPVPNKIAFEKAIKLALALNCNITHETKFDRKNYFYPDLAKGYQISQYDQPIGTDGYLEIEVEGDSRRIRIQRIHIEEDTAKSIHSENDETLIDFNKSGVGLIEIVTYPDFESVEEVLSFSKRLKQVVKYLDVSDAEMQKGQMRFELNISVSSNDRKTIIEGKLPSYKVEVKNIGSISVLEKVMNFETIRQSKILESGEIIVSQTRGLKAMTGETLFQRSKESADDYRYFPEPDIPPIHISHDLIDLIKDQIPELPVERKYRYLNLGLESEQADIFVEDRNKGDWFDIIISKIDLEKEKFLIKETAKWIVGELSGQIEKRNLNIQDSKITQDNILELVRLIKNNKISGTIAKEVINDVFTLGGDPIEIIKTKNLMQTSDSSEIENIVNQVLVDNKKVLNDLNKNPNAIKFLVGQVMKLSKGRINPKVAEEILKNKLTSL